MKWHDHECGTHLPSQELIEIYQVTDMADPYVIDNSDGLHWEVSDDGDLVRDKKSDSSVV